MELSNQDVQEYYEGILESEKVNIVTEEATETSLEKTQSERNKQLTICNKL